MVGQTHLGRLWLELGREQSDHAPEDTHAVVAHVVENEPHDSRYGLISGWLPVAEQRSLVFRYPERYPEHFRQQPSASRKTRLTHCFCLDNIWCCRRGLNSRPLPYQGSALPLSYGS